ncbi:MAG: hypothetical protein AABY84_06530 [Candidatus Firestonebacteria bacterium]
MDNLKDIYISYFNQMRDGESNIFKFLTTLFTAIGGFYIVVKNNVVENNLDWLLFSAIGSTIVLIWGILYVLSIGYTHRYLQVIMWYYENKLKLPNFKSWDPKKFKKLKVCQSLLLEPTPGIYKIHLIGFIMGIMLVWYWYGFLKNNNHIGCVIILFLIVWLLTACLNYYYMNKLKKIIEKGINNDKT